MRRIYKSGHVTTSEKFFLLEDVADHSTATENSDDTWTDRAEADGASSQDLADQNTVTPEDEDSPSARPASRRSATYGTVQEIAQLEQLRDQMIAQATSEAARLLQEAHAKAQLEYNEALARAAEQIEHDRQTACEEGQQQAFAQTTQDIIGCIRGIEQTLARLESAQAGFITGYEQDLKWTALEIAQKILMDTIVADDTRLVPLVMAAVNSASGAPWMTVEISEHMAGLLTQLQHKINSLSDTGRINLRLVDAPPDTCIIETPDRFFDASITQQIENLKGYFAAEQG